MDLVSIFKKIIKNVIDNIIQNIFYLVYIYLSIKHNSAALTFNDIVKHHVLCCNAPYIGNFAFPDYYSVYITTFFPPRQKISYASFKQSIQDNYIILSITFYDNSGKIIEYYDDNINSTEYTTHNYCCAIIRIYSNEPTNTVQYLIHNNKINVDVVKQNTNNFTDFYVRLMRLKKINVDKTICGFRLSKINLSLYFTNYRARYLVCSVDNIKDIVIIKATKPECGIHKQLRYFGFMVCNITTTETDDCINYDDLENNYTIFVTKSCLHAKNNGYNEHDTSHKIMYWKQTNDNPIIVYREIRIDNEGLFSLNNHASQEEIKMVMGDYFPNTHVIKS